MIYNVLLFIVVLSNATNINKRNISQLNHTGYEMTKRKFYSYGGTNANIKLFPYMVSIQNTFSNNHFCGGAIISKKHILSAAHCFCNLPHSKSSGEIQIIAGITTLSFSQDSKYYVEKIICHEKFLPKFQYHDIAILVVFDNIKYTTNVNQVELSRDPVPFNSPVVMSGWGSKRYGGLNSYDLKYIVINTIDLDECRKMLQRVGLDDFVKEWNICTFHRTKRACSMDSGSPLVYNEQIVGIVSWSDACNEDMPDVYTSVSAHFDWIMDVITKDKHKNIYIH